MKKRERDELNFRFTFKSFSDHEITTEKYFQVRKNDNINEIFALIVEKRK